MHTIILPGKENEWTTNWQIELFCFGICLPFVIVTNVNKFVGWSSSF